MGRLSGFRYREIIRRLKLSGFAFDRQAADSHENVLLKGQSLFFPV